MTYDWIYFYFKPVYYTYLVKIINRVKIVFLTLTFRPLSLEPTHSHYKQRVNKTFVIKYTPRG